MENDVAAVERLSSVYESLKCEIAKVIVGQEQVVEELMVTLFAQGHCLLVGVPGLAKTLLIRTLASTLSLGFNRIQFTPDLMPADVTGTEVIQSNRTTGEREFRFVPGPIFTNVVLADEINRTPPKTQAALLEAMQERQVTLGGQKHPLPSPFFVLATQNPIEQEGTYPLPEAQLDRFMLQINVDYPSEDEELEIVMRTTASQELTLQPLLNEQEIQELSAIVRRIPIAEHVAREALRLVRGTRPDVEYAPACAREFIMWGAGPRASQNLVLAAKARAALHGRFSVDRDDILAMALPVMRHRIKTNFHADAEGVSASDLIRQIVEQSQAETGKQRDHLSQVFRSSDAG